MNVADITTAFRMSLRSLSANVRVAGFLVAGCRSSVLFVSVLVSEVAFLF